ncbi:hypothetical protein DB827_12790, partial [Xanthomonas perforans]
MKPQRYCALVSCPAAHRHARTPLPIRQLPSPVCAAQAASPIGARCRRPGRSGDPCGADLLQRVRWRSD